MQFDLAAQARGYAQNKGRYRILLGHCSCAHVNQQDRCQNHHPQEICESAEFISKNHRKTRLMWNSAAIGLHFLGSTVTAWASLSSLRWHPRTHMKPKANLESCALTFPNNYIIMCIYYIYICVCVSKNIKVNQHNQLEITSQYIAKDKNTYRVVRPTHERIAETATFPQIIWLADVSRSPCFRAAVWAWSQT